MNLDTYRQILLQSDPDDLLNICLTDKNFQQICNDHGFWSEKYRQMGVTIVEKQASVAEYVQDLKNCLNILPAIDAVLEKLHIAEGDIENNHYEMIGLTYKLNDLRSLRIPGVDLELVQRMINSAKKYYLENQIGVSFIQMVTMDNLFGLVSEWGADVVLQYRPNTQQYLLFIYLQRIRKQTVFNITESIRTYIYLLFYYGVPTRFVIDTTDSNYPDYE